MIHALQRNGSGSGIKERDRLPHSERGSDLVRHREVPEEAVVARRRVREQGGKLVPIPTGIIVPYLLPHEVAVRVAEHGPELPFERRVREDVPERQRLRRNPRDHRKARVASSKADGDVPHLFGINRQTTDERCERSSCE